jgi:hypothetical protein
MGHPSGIGLAEFMNYPGVIHRDPEAMAKLRLFEGGHIDGHCPLLSGRDLNAYVAAGHLAPSTRRPARRRRARSWQGDAGADPRRLGVEGSRGAATGADRAHGALHVPVHRRPQPARHRGGGASRPHDPAADRARHPAAGGLPGRVAVGGGGVRAQGSGPDRAGQARRYRGARQPGLLPAQATSSGPAAWCHDARPSPARGTVAPVGPHSVKAPACRPPASARPPTGRRPTSSASSRARSSPSICTRRSRSWMATSAPTPPATCCASR